MLCFDALEKSNVMSIMMHMHPQIGLNTHRPRHHQIEKTHPWETDHQFHKKDLANKWIYVA